MRRHKRQDARCKRLPIWGLILPCFLYLASCSLATVVSGNELVDQAHKYDKQVVEFQGEVIGDIMARGDHVWMNVNDGTRAIGIWAKKELVADIEVTGDYNHIGDQVKVTGVFYRADPKHGVDLDIRAARIEVFKTGYEIKHPIDPRKVWLAGILFALTLGVHLFYVIRKRLKAKA